MSVHLFTRSHYSLLNGLMSVEDIVLTAKEKGFTQIALTDYRVMFSHLEFYILSKKHGIKPIFGLEIDLNQGTSLLLAKDIKGYQMLQRLSYKMSQNEVIELRDFSDHMDHLIFIVHSENGPFEDYLSQDHDENIHFKFIEIKREIPNFYLGISHQESNFFKKRNTRLHKIAKEHDIEVVALPKVFYKNKTDHQYFKALRAIDNGKLLDDPTINLAPDRYFYDQNELNALYSSESLILTDTLANLCNVDLMALKTQLPEFENDKDVSNQTFLMSLAQAGLHKRLEGQITDTYQDRLNFELDVLINMDFTNYFLIVYDVIRYAKQNGINVGPGRGSAAGSLVAYALGITEVDPIAYDLLFERFLNPERASMPDIDIDFPDDKRDQVVRYVQDKYGHAHVAHIIAFGTLKARQSFRDSARILNVPIHKVDQVSKSIDPKGLMHSYKSNKRFSTLIDNDNQLKRCFTLALNLEGTPRHVTQHAAGIVLSAKPLIDVVPLYKIDNDNHVIQFDMTHIEDLGLIKIDFLGIKNLSIIDRIIHKINEDNSKFNIKSIPFDDSKTFELLSDAHTTGIFQLESDGIRQLLKQLKPSRFTDVVDVIALFRPGPMENIPLYLENRKHPNKIDYYHNDLKSITLDTYGVLIYQEQIMQVAQIFAGFTLAKADILRRAMSSKDEKVLRSLENDFKAGALNKGYEVNLVNQIFELIYKFANYGFNKSHSVAYGMVSYQMAYLKANYSEIFYTELLSSVIGDDRKTKLYIDECRRLNVLLMGPNLDESKSNYFLEAQKIRLPFTMIKGISRQISETIVNERLVNGRYTSFYAAVVRLKAQDIKKHHFERLIDAGAFDYFGFNRLSLHASLDEAIQYASIVTIHDALGQTRFDFDLVSEPVFTQVKNDRKEVLAREFQVLGFYLSDYPTLSLKRKHSTDGVMQLVPSDKSYRAIVKVDRIKQHRAKNGKMMSFVDLSDDSGNIGGVIFPNVYERYGSDLNVDDIILIKGKVKEEGSILIDQIHVFSL
ncbi:MAG: DNA polymerase III subunit alpha [Erysipelothrix sp.]|nr:DNA polymerase III subunit alpha [Erysipelothrix sp.]